MPFLILSVKYGDAHVAADFKSVNNYSYSMCIEWTLYYNRFLNFNLNCFVKNLKVCCTDSYMLHHDIVIRWNIYVKYFICLLQIVQQREAMYYTQRAFMLIPCFN